MLPREFWTISADRHPIDSAQGVAPASERTILSMLVRQNATKHNFDIVRNVPKHPLADHSWWLEDNPHDVPEQPSS